MKAQHHFLKIYIHIFSRLANISSAEQKAILGQCSNEYVCDDITAAMLIQLDNIERRDSRWGKTHYPAEPDLENSFHQQSEPPGSLVASSAPSVAGDEDSEDEEALVADLEELEWCLSELNIDDLRDDECEAMAAEAQNLGARAGKRAQTFV